MKLILIIMSLVTLPASVNPHEANKSVQKNKMEVTWRYKAERIHFKMSAPTDGWVTIGFNTKAGMQGAYLLMGRVRNGTVELVEHYTISSGNYKSLSKLGVRAEASNISGLEKGQYTEIEFSLPINAQNKYARDLPEGQEYTMTLAYSQEDDFQHHSTMRTAINVKL